MLIKYDSVMDWFLLLYQTLINEVAHSKNVFMLRSVA